MVFAGSRYYKINRILLTCIGLWPYYTQRAKYAYCIFLFLLLLFNIFCQLSSFITKEYSVNLLLNVLPYNIPTIYFTFKYLIMLINGNKVKELIEQMRYDWNSLKKKEEFKIIQNRTNIGRFCTIIMLIWTYTILFLFILMFFSPNILNVVMPLNKSRKLRQLPDSMEFFIDKEKYIELLTSYFFLILTIFITITVTIETFLQMCIHHTCAMFQITSYRIECILNRNQTKSLVSQEKFNNHKNIVEAVNSHRNAIEFIDSVKSTFSVAHVFGSSLGVILLSINLYLLCKYLMAKDIYSMSISFLYIVTQFCYMFFFNYMGQQVIDYSNNIFKKTYNTRWYATPLNTQKCLIIITYRSMKTYTLTIRFGLFVPSLEGFASLISRSLSYFMVLYSLR